MLDEDIILPKLMEITPLPVYRQRRLPIRQNLEQTQRIYQALNETVFDNRLLMPTFNIGPRRRKYWGMCYGEHYTTHDTGSSCEIVLMDKWYSVQWLITILAHEMCHQYQWDIEGAKRRKEGRSKIMSHGPSFFMFRDKLKEQNIPLKTSYSANKWFKSSDMFKS